jgi:hypothetical protein
MQGSWANATAIQAANNQGKAYQQGQQQSQDYGTTLWGGINAALSGAALVGKELSNAVKQAGGNATNPYGNTAYPTGSGYGGFYYGSGGSGGGGGGGGSASADTKQQETADFLGQIAKAGYDSIKTSVENTNKMAEGAKKALDSSFKVGKQLATLTQSSDFMAQRLKTLYSAKALQDSMGVAGGSGGGLLDLIRNTRDYYDTMRNESLGSLRTDLGNLGKEYHDSNQSIIDTKNQYLIDATNQAFEGARDYITQLYNMDKKFVDGTKGSKLYDKDKGITYPEWLKEFFNSGFNEPEKYELPGLVYGDNESHAAAANRSGGKPAPISRSGSINPEYLQALATPYRQRGGNSRI